MNKKQETIEPASPVVLRTLGGAFLSVGHKRGIESFVESGEYLLDVVDDLDPPPKQDVARSSEWIAVSVSLAAIGVGLTLLLGWLAGDYWSVSWGMAPLVVLFAWTPWGIESDRRNKDARDAFFRLEEWRRRRL